ncbi:MAG: hypothetical protein Q4P06_02720 [Actinomycetaceae bacterium]|nr:hypothetical protein [Actinomycetaceae bacterium]
MEPPIFDNLEDMYRNEAGDVPGWVLVTLMTIAVATAIWAIAQDRLIQLFNDALNSINVGGNN